MRFAHPSPVPAIVLFGLSWLASCSMVRAVAAPNDDEGLTPTYLRCEYHADPMGIDCRKPRLSWIVESKARGQKQTAYRVLVAGSEETLTRDEGDLWDSGKVEGDDTPAIVYDGHPLGSHQPCHWKVQVWDRDGKASGWSAPASWSMGLLEPSDWHGAEWIGSDRERKVELADAPFEGRQVDLARRPTRGRTSR